MFHRIRKYAMLRTFARKLAIGLRDASGTRDSYTRPDVDAALKRLRLYKTRYSFDDYFCFAYAMFCSQEAFEQICRQEGSDLNYQQIRDDISATLYRSPVSFTTSTLIRDASPAHPRYHGTTGGTGSDAEAGGGFDGGGGE